MVTDSSIHLMVLFKLLALCSGVKLKDG